MSERAKQTQLPGTFAENSHVAAIALGTSDEVVIFKNDKGATIKITGIGYVPDTAVTGDNTDYMTLAVQNKGTAGTGTTAVTATKSYVTGVNMTAFVEDALTLSTTAANLLVAPGETLSLVKGEAAAGLGLPAGKAVINYQYV